MFASFSANETPLGPSPQAVKALQDMAHRVSEYPDGGAVKPERAGRVLSYSIRTC